MGRSNVGSTDKVEPSKSHPSDSQHIETTRKTTNKASAPKEADGTGPNAMSRAISSTPSQLADHKSANGGRKHARQTGNAGVTSHHHLPHHYRSLGSSPTSSGGYGPNAFVDPHFAGPHTNGGPVGPKLPRPVDKLHGALRMFHDELESLIALVSAPHPPFDGAVTAWKEEALAQLLLEIVPALGATSARVAEAVRVGMMNNYGAVRINGHH